MQAHTVKDAIVITCVHRMDGQLVLEMECADFDAYKALPAVVSYDGVVCGKTGWSSDRNYACYKSGVPLAYKVPETYPCRSCQNDVPKDQAFCHYCMTDQ